MTLKFWVLSWPQIIGNNIPVGPIRRIYRGCRDSVDSDIILNPIN